MKRIVNELSHAFCPYIDTEKTIFETLDLKSIDDKYSLIQLPLAHIINTYGLENTNRIISSIDEENRVFICQHILVDKLNFRDDDIVFTPHSTINDKFITIPHFSENIDTVYGNNDKYPFSFLGSTKTHHIRKQIVENYDYCYDSKVYWGLDTEMSQSFKRRYIELLGDSKYSLAPRGTGISSVRLFEAIAMGSFPIVIADGYQFPLDNIIEWDKISLHIKESDVDIIPSIIENSPELDKLYLREVYNRYLSNYKLSETVYLTLKS